MACGTHPLLTLPPRWLRTAALALVLLAAERAGAQLRELPPVNGGPAPRTAPRIYRLPVIHASLQQAADEPDPAPLEDTELPEPRALEPLPLPGPVPGPDPEPLLVPPLVFELTDVEEYRIQPSDQLEIKFRQTPELNESVVVRPDGKIALQLIGDVLAAELTVAELRNNLRHAYAQTLKEPEIVVIVRRFAANHVFVGGEVETPGLIPISGRLTAVRAVILAGGFKDTADARRVLLRRDGAPYQQLNLKQQLQGRRLDQDVPLRPYDVIYVPKSPIAKANLFVQQYIEKVLPFSRYVAVSVSKSSGPSVNRLTTP